VREPGPIRPRGGQRVVDVGDAKDAGGKWNVLALEAIRISLAVPALVVIADDRAYVPGKIDVCDQLEAGLRVSFHDGPLFVGELARLVQYFGRNDDLSDVVQ